MVSDSSVTKLGSENGQICKHELGPETINHIPLPLPLPLPLLPRPRPAIPLPPFPALSLLLASAEEVSEMVTVDFSRVWYTMSSSCLVQDSDT